MIHHLEIDLVIAGHVLSGKHACHSVLSDQSQSGSENPCSVNFCPSAEQNCSPQRLGEDMQMIIHTNFHQTDSSLLTGACQWLFSSPSYSDSQGYIVLLTLSFMFKLQCFFAFYPALLSVTLVSLLKFSNLTLLAMCLNK